VGHGTRLGAFTSRRWINNKFNICTERRNLVPSTIQYSHLFDKDKESQNSDHRELRRGPSRAARFRGGGGHGGRERSGRRGSSWRRHVEYILSWKQPLPAAAELSPHSPSTQQQQPAFHALLVGTLACPSLPHHARNGFSLLLFASAELLANVCGCSTRGVRVCSMRM
jgi:hypothetical protein